MKIIKNFALLMLIVFLFQLGFNGCAALLKNCIVKNITISYEDKSEHILRKHCLFYGAIGAWAAHDNKKDIQKGYKNGVLAGEIAYFGKKVARKRGFGLIGQAIHSLGISMLENQILNKPLLSRYKIFLPPTSLELDIQEGFNCQLLSGSLLGILTNIVGLKNASDNEGLYVALLLQTALGQPEYLLKEITEKIWLGEGDYFQPRDSFLAGAPVFVFNKSSNDDGYNIGGVITVKKDFNSLAHEMIHSCQYRELAVINLLIERSIFKDFPMLFSQDLAYILVHALFGELEEEEPKEYDRIYKN